MDEDNKDKFDNKEEDTLKSDQERKSESDSTETLNTQDTNNELEKSNENDNLTENPENLQSQDEIVEQNIRPAVAKDGADITFRAFNNGSVLVPLQGSFSGCPTSTITLKQGVQNLLCHYIPEVNEVEAF